MHSKKDPPPLPTPTSNSHNSENLSKFNNFPPTVPFRHGLTGRNGDECGLYLRWIGARLAVGYGGKHVEARDGTGGTI